MRSSRVTVYAGSSPPSPLRYAPFVFRENTFFPRRLASNTTSLLSSKGLVSMKSYVDPTGARRQVHCTRSTQVTKVPGVGRAQSPLFAVDLARYWTLPAAMFGAHRRRRGSSLRWLIAHGGWHRVTKSPCCICDVFFLPRSL